MEKQSTLRGRLLAMLRQRRLLIRLLVSTLLIACIPLIIISTLLINGEKNNAAQTQRRQLTDVATAVASQIDVFVDSATRVNTKMQLAGELYENVIGQSVQTELDGLQLIRYFTNALPFVSSYGLYFPSGEGMVYADTGKYSAAVYAQRVVSMEPTAFVSSLALAEKAQFVHWDDLGGNMLYIAPIRMGSIRTITRVGVYVLSPSSLLSALKIQLMDTYRLAAIYDEDDRLLYLEANSPISILSFEDSRFAEVRGGDGAAYVASLQSSGKGYQCVVYMRQSEFQHNMETISAYVRNLAILNVVICILLLIMVVMFNYRPLARVVKNVRYYDDAPPADQNEMEYLLDVYKSLAEEKEQLKIRVYEQKLLIIDHTLESILSGRQVSPRDMESIAFLGPDFLVINAYLKEARNVEALIEGNHFEAPVYVIEMYFDNLLAFICHVDDPSQAGQDAILRRVRELVQDEEIRLGVSAVQHELSRLFPAYREAEKNLRASAVTSPAGTLAPALASPLDAPETVPRLANALKSGDAFVISYARAAFEAVPTTQQTPHAQRYAAYQIIDLYRYAAKTAGMTLEMPAIQRTLQEGSLEEIRDALVRTLIVLCEKRQRQPVETVDETYAHVLAFINENFANPLFCMNDVAAYLGVTVFAASRMLKSMTGINFRRYLNDMRVEYARDLLQTTDLPVNDIAEQAGFTSASYFITIFKQTEGVTPSHFRKHAGYKPGSM